MAIRPIPKLHGKLTDLQGSQGRHASGITLNGLIGHPVDVRTSTVLVLNGRLYLMPVYIPRPVRFASLRCRVTVVGTAGAVARMGIYQGASADPLPSGTLLGAPHRLVLDAGTVTTDVLNIRSVAASGTLPEGLFWFGIVGQGAPATQATLSGPAATPPNPLIAQTADLAPLSGAFLDGVTGALPDNIGELISPISATIAAVSMFVAEYL
jgi:hypothetical protein